MNSGSVTAVRTVLGLIAGFSILLWASVSLAQTPDEACAADSLYLISPDAMDLRQQVTGRPGLTISWEDLDTSEATCYTMTGLEALDFSVDVQGGFGDNVDRVFGFTSPDSGSIGHQISKPLLLAWQTEGSSFNGVLAGSINLANNGGLLRLASDGVTWSQQNGSLPQTWRQTNMTALAEGSNGFKVAAFSAGTTLETDLQGLWTYTGSSWTRIAEGSLASNIIITQLAVSPGSNDVFALGTSRNGLFVTNDGGQTFTNFGADLDPDYDPLPVNFRVGSLNWDSSRLWVFFPNFGLFYSEDNGNSFTRSVIEVDEDIDSTVVPPVMILPTAINEITVDRSDADHIFLCLNFNGVWESNDGGQTWHDLYGDLIVPGTEWLHSAKSVAIDPVDSQILVVGMIQKGIYRTTDGGNTWTVVGETVQPPSLSTLTDVYVRSVPTTPGLFYVLEDNWKLLRSTDSGATWDFAPVQPFQKKGRQLLVSRDGSGDVLMGTYGGGIYEAGTPLNLSDTYNSGTSAHLRDLELGLEITFGDGVLDNNDFFQLICQTFQGWAVWRAPSHDRTNMTLLGLFDRVNPESCIEGYCGDNNYEIVPQCYASKRAACFNFDTADSVRFFDDEVYNGFSYFYSVSTFDYGNTALTTPQNNTNAMVFSPRYSNDPISPFPGNGNLTFIQINSDTVDPASGETIFVYPNPLRRDAGIPGSEGKTMIFTNLPPQARVRVFTTAGDDVINLGPDNLHAGNIYWSTTNRDGEPVAPGVYLYKVLAPSMEDFWGRLVIIR